MNKYHFYGFAYQARSDKKVFYDLYTTAKSMNKAISNFRWVIHKETGIPLHLLEIDRGYVQEIHREPDDQLSLFDLFPEVMNRG